MASAWTWIYGATASFFLRNYSCHSLHFLLSWRTTVTESLSYLTGHLDGHKQRNLFGNAGPPKAARANLSTKWYQTSSLRPSSVRKLDFWKIPAGNHIHLQMTSAVLVYLPPPPPPHTHTKLQQWTMQWKIGLLIWNAIHINHTQYQVRASHSEQYTTYIQVTVAYISQRALLLVKQKRMTSPCSNAEENFSMNLDCFLQYVQRAQVLHGDAVVIRQLIACSLLCRGSASHT